MVELGKFALLLGLFLSGYAVITDTLGRRRQDKGLMKSAANAVVSTWICLSVAIIILCALLVRSDFSVRYVANHSSRDLPLIYKVSALWAGSAGSLLLWLWLQVGFIAIVFCNSKARTNGDYAAARSIANLVSVFFLAILIMDKNPFGVTAVTASDGVGLNPLLQHPAMVLHPPILFIGYAGFVIPFAWAFAMLRSDRTQLSTTLFKQAGKWTLIAWMFLTIGIVLGAWWAYEELGWGGYWSWDPVENASLLPWLAATALLHCYRFYKKDSSLSVWTIVLSIVTFSLCVLGRFITKYLGTLLASVHAFTEQGLGILYLVLLIFIWVLAGIFMWRKYHKATISVPVPKSTSQKFIILNNILMLLIALVIFTGTLFPFFSGIVTKQKIGLEPEFFTKLTAPFGLILLLFIGICPYLVRFGINKSRHTISAGLTAMAALIIWWFSGSVAPACLVVCCFAAINLSADLAGRYLQKRGRGDILSVSKSGLRWNGARIVRIGVVLVFMGIAGSGGYGIEEQAALRPGDKVTVSGFEVSYDGLSADHGTNFIAVTADISVRKGEKLIASLRPSLAYYDKQKTRTSEVDIKRTFAGDLYLALTEVDNSSELINLKVLIKPLVNWIWLGSIVSIFGVVLVLISLYKRKTTATIDLNKDIL